MSRSDHELWIQQVLTNEDIINHNIIFTGTTKKGDGYASSITFATASGTTKNGEAKQLDLAIKDNNAKGGVSANVSLKPFFLREIKIYQEILPEFQKFQTERNVKSPFVSYPKSYKTVISDDMEALLLQNMKTIGYEIHDIKKQFNSEHLNSILREYGKLHALSFALRDQNQELYLKLTENYPDIVRRATNKNGYFMKGFMNVVKKNVEILRRNGELELLEKYRKMEEDTEKTIIGTDYESDPYAVIIHGDCWNNNFMFHYKDHQKEVPDKVVILDWQCSKLASPVFDLTYFYYCCVHIDHIDQLDVAWDVYYESFSGFLTELGSDPSKLYPKALLKVQWKKYAKVGLLFGCLSRQMPFVDMESVNTEEDDAIFLDFKLNNQELFEERIIKFIRHFVENDFI